VRYVRKCHPETWQLDNRWNIAANLKIQRGLDLRPATTLYPLYVEKIQQLIDLVFLFDDERIIYTAAESLIFPQRIFD
jgi:hypothetical protein